MSSNFKKTFDNKNTSLIVVDNNSLKNDEEEKIKEYTSDIIKIDNNLGFAKANNLGCKYAIEKYKPDFLAVINNDVFIEQKEFIDIIEKDYQKYHFDLLGPWIESRTGESCNPFPVYKDKQEVEKSIEKNKKLVDIYNNAFLYFLLNVYLCIKHFIKKPDVPTNSKTFKESVALHGCAIIFSKNIMKNMMIYFTMKHFYFMKKNFYTIV